MNKIRVKTSTSIEYERRIQKVLDYIELNLNQVIRLDELASVSCFSVYHFHRIFHAMIGETVNDYVNRKRMEKAVYRIINQPELSITELAHADGFSSSANFSRAFKQYFGITPSELREAGSIEKGLLEVSNIGKIYRKYGKVFNPRELYSQSVTNTIVIAPEKLKEFLMNIKVEDIKEKPIIYLSSPRGYELASVYETWDKIIKWADEHGIKNDWNQRFALCHDNPAITPEEKCRYDASIVVDKDVSVSFPFKKSFIPAGTYAIAYFKDEAGKINQFMTELCSNWLCSSGYEPDDFPPIFNYLNDDGGAEQVEMNVYLKIRDLRATE